MKTLLIVLVIVAAMVAIVAFLLRALSDKCLEEQTVNQAELEKAKAAEKARKEKEAAEKALEEEAVREAQEKAFECSIEHPVEEEPCKHNCYFFNIYKYTSSKGKDIFCVICKASIDGHWYSIKVNNSYYPNITSYTDKCVKSIISRFLPDMTYEEFVKQGSLNLDNVREYVRPLING